MTESEKKIVIDAIKKINTATGCKFLCTVDGQNSNISEINKKIEIITLPHKHVPTFLNGIKTGINFAKAKGVLNPSKTRRKKTTVKKTDKKISPKNTRRKPTTKKKTTKRKSTKARKK